MMKNILFKVSLMAFLLFGCREEGKRDGVIKFATSADYPPFEFMSNGEIVGFDIDVAKLIAKELSKEAVFIDIQYSNILPAVQGDSVDAGISTITATDERRKNFDFSSEYYKETLVMIYKSDSPIRNENEIGSKKIAAQLGSTMEIWLKSNTKDAIIILMDNNNQAVEALKVGHVDGVLVDSFQGKMFCMKNPELSFKVISQSENGYAIAFKKGSLLKEEVNSVLEKLTQLGEIKKLEDKWLK
ncbi:MAG: ABC transporter substrate-binding protein [Pseudomonadota bacterium]